jgi:DNA 3'-phosphatase
MSILHSLTFESVLVYSNKETPIIQYPHDDGLHMFDLDDTLYMRSKTLNSRFDYNKLRNRDFIVVSNQGGNTKDKTLYDRVNKFFNSLYELLDREVGTIIVFMARKKDNYRKPNTGLSGLISLHSAYKPCLYVGDAAGRSGDHSDCDFEFANNMNIRFVLPENY